MLFSSLVSAAPAWADQSDFERVIQSVRELAYSVEQTKPGTFELSADSKYSDPVGFVALCIAEGGRYEEGKTEILRRVPTGTGSYENRTSTITVEQCQF